MKTTRTNSEIVARIKWLSEDMRDFFGAQTNDLLCFLPFADAKQFLNDDCTEEQFAECQETDVSNAACKYLPFAWEKANDCRGLSANRSVDHMAAYLWLAGFDQDAIDSWREDYHSYGKPQLVAASACFGFDWRAHDNGVWIDDEEGPGIPSSTRDQEIATRESWFPKATEVGP